MCVISLWSNEFFEKGHAQSKKVFTVCCWGHLHGNTTLMFCHWRIRIRGTL